MVTEQEPARRRRRRRRPANPPPEGDAGAVAEPRGRYVQRAPAAPARYWAKWEWRTFPVFFAFVFGMALVGLFSRTALFQPLYIFAFVGTAIGLAHMLTRWLFSRRR